MKWILNCVLVHAYTYTYMSVDVCAIRRRCGRGCGPLAHSTHLAYFFSREVRFQASRHRHVSNETESCALNTEWRRRCNKMRRVHLCIYLEFSSAARTDDDDDDGDNIMKRSDRGERTENDEREPSADRPNTLGCNLQVKISANMPTTNTKPILHAHDGKMRDANNKYEKFKCVLGIHLRPSAM